MTGLVDRLRATTPFVNDPISLKPRLRNLDGPEAAIEIERLEAEVSRLREALTLIEAAMMRGGDGKILGMGWSITKLNKARPTIHDALGVPDNG